MVSSLAATLGSASGKNFVDQYLAAEMTQTFVALCPEVQTYILSLTCDEAADEAATTRIEKVLKLSCSISGSTNFMLNGILDVSEETYFAL